MMKKIILSGFVLAIAAMSSSTFAQEGSTDVNPIFIKPYELGSNYYSDNIPNLVRAPVQKQSSAATTRSSAAALEDYYAQRRNRRDSGYQLVKIKNPYENTPYLRVRSEKDYYDKPSRMYYNQYDYMKLLHDRGDISRHNQVKNYLQKYAIFNPTKYQEAMSAPRVASSTGSTASDGKEQSTNGGVSVIVRQKDTVNSPGGAAPQKLHQDYDDDVPSSSPNRPIFLR